MEQVKIVKYRQINKGALRAFFTLVFYPEEMQIIDCLYFVQGEKVWWKFPEKEVAKEGKKEYFPVIKMWNKEMFASLNEKVIAQLKEHDGQSNPSQKRQENPLQDDASSLWF